MLQKIIAKSSQCFVGFKAVLNPKPEMLHIAAYQSIDAVAASVFFTLAWFSPSGQ